MAHWAIDSYDKSRDLKSCLEKEEITPKRLTRVSIDQCGDWQWTLR